MIGPSDFEELKLILKVVILYSFCAIVLIIVWF